MPQRPQRRPLEKRESTANGIAERGCIRDGDDLDLGMAVTVYSAVRQSMPSGEDTAEAA